MILTVLKEPLGLLGRNSARTINTFIFWGYFLILLNSIFCNTLDVFGPKKYSKKSIYQKIQKVFIFSAEKAISYLTLFSRLHHGAKVNTSEKLIFQSTVIVDIVNNTLHTHKRTFYLYLRFTAQSMIKTMTGK